METIWTALFGAASPEVVATAIATVVALCVVWIPFWRGIRVALRAHAATAAETAPGLVGARKPDVGESMADMLEQILVESVRDNQAGHPGAFLRDAARQYVLHEYDETYSEPMSMYANILPPIGFIGTTLGLIALFGSMHFSDQALQVGALGLALTSTLFALSGFATLEGIQIALRSRLRRSLDATLNGPPREPARTTAEALG